MHRFKPTDRTFRQYNGVRASNQSSKSGGRKRRGQKEDLAVQGDAGGGAYAHLRCAESAEVVGGLGDDVGEELHREPPLQLAAHGDVHDAAGFLLRRSFSGR